MLVCLRVDFLKPNLIYLLRLQTCTKIFKNKIFKDGLDWISNWIKIFKCNTLR